MPQIAKWKVLCWCALSNGVPRRSFSVALVVGTILNLINQGNAIFGSEPVNWLKFVLTYFVPYAVCTYGAVSAQAEQLNRTTGAGAPWPS